MIYSASCRCVETYRCGPSFLVSRNERALFSKPKKEKMSEVGESEVGRDVKEKKLFRWRCSKKCSVTDELVSKAGT
jgi:hypothetical protein